MGRARVLQTTWLNPLFCVSFLVGRARASEGHESSNLPGLAHPFCTSTLVGQARALEESSKLPGSANLSLPTILVGRAWVPEGYESSKLPGSAHLSSTTTWSGGPGYRKGASPLNYPAQPTFLCFQPSWAGSSIGRARVIQATRLSHLFCAINPDNLSGLAPFQKGRILDSSMTTSPSPGKLATRRRLHRLHN
jgi:hypothetical protein